MTKSLKRICWISKLTGFTQKGEPLDDATADRECDQLNKEFPTHYHWTEEVADEQ